MGKYVTLKKSDFNEFIEKLSKIKPVVAPVAKGKKSFAFAEVTTGEEVALQYIPTILPPKKYFMPQKEKILEFDKKKQDWTPILEYSEKIIFGVHTCDLAGIQSLNIVFTTKPKDINYIVRKDKLVIIGLECNNYCDEHASCAVMDNHLPNGGYDLFFTELKNSFMIHVNTQIGDEIIKRIKLFQEAKKQDFQQLDDLRAAKRKIFKDEVKVGHEGLKNLFDKSVKSKVWKDIDSRCVACGNCTNVCPTCYCFDVKDDINLDFNTGARYRVWDSCQNENFAKVAGGESFREDRGSRQLHRFMRKFSYPVEKFSRYFCTGCGRCSRTCMAQINLKETINALVKEKK
ncbi:MAG: 4Fe-4S dicluster domain-containing protein [Candidatus Omnitrophica bacterium]|nr:4Fe-4S dicluster domain-containing protein [Candidatus Omnitrophota bacterium]